MSYVDGLSSGLDTTAIITQLMQIERRPQAALSARKTQAEKARTELAGIRSDINSLRNLAKDFRLNSVWNKVTAASSNPEAVAVSASSAATTGSYSFRVTSLATAASVYSTNTFASLDSVVAPSGSSLFSASGYNDLGFSALSGTGFDPGDIAFEVIQSSTAARLDGVVGIPAVPIEIDPGTNDQIDIEVSGFSYSITLTAGTYNSEQALATAVNDAIANSAAAGKVTAQLNESNQIQLAATAEGSANTLTVTGGSALGSLGFTAGATAAGTDGIVSVNGTQTTVNNTAAGTQVTLASGGAGSITATLGGPLRAGTASVSQVGVGGGTLRELVDNVNSSNLSYTAAAVNTGSGYRLQLTARESGAGSAFTPSAELFGSTAFTPLSAGTDAVLTIDGDNPFTISSSTNTFDNLLPGVDVTVSATTASSVTVSTERDHAAITDQVKALVDKLNEVLDRVAKSTASVPGGERSVLQGSGEARRAADALRQALVGPVDGSSFGSVGLVGLELTREGRIEFDADEFTRALETNRTDVAALFTSPSGSPAAGALDRLVEAADAAAATSSGYLVSAGEANDRRIDEYGRQIDAYERRLELREAGLRRTYANLEVALNGLQKQSSNLAAQLGSFGGN